MSTVHTNPLFSAKLSRWSFGGNRLQVKAEIRLMADVEAALRSVSALFVQAFGCLQSLANKQELLLALLENERMRLTVWLYPLDHERRHLIPFSNSGKGPSDVCSSFHSLLFKFGKSCLHLSGFPF